MTVADSQKLGAQPPLKARTAEFPFVRDLIGGLLTEPGTAVSVWNPSGEMLYANDVFRRLARVPTTTTPDRLPHMRDILPGPWAERKLEIIRQVAHAGRPAVSRVVWNGERVRCWLQPIHCHEAQGSGEAPCAHEVRVLLISRVVMPTDCDANAEYSACQPVEYVDQGFMTLGPLDVLSPRELEVFTLLGQGLSVKDVATTLHRSQATIENHRDAIYRKLGIQDRAGLVLLSSKVGLTLDEVQHWTRL